MLEITPANTITTVTTLGEALSTMARTVADRRPDFSATPMPSMATSTTPSGAKPVKLLTMPVKMRRRPSPLSRLTAVIMPSSDRPGAPSGRGSSTDRPMAPNRPDRKTMPIASTANRVTGCGSRLPSHSTPSRKRVKAPRRAGGVGDGGSGPAGPEGAASVILGS